MTRKNTTIEKRNHDCVCKDCGKKFVSFSSYARWKCIECQNENRNSGLRSSRSKKDVRLHTSLIERARMRFGITVEEFLAPIRNRMWPRIETREEFISRTGDAMSGASPLYLAQEEDRRDRREWQKQYYAMNREKMIEKNRKYREKIKEKKNSLADNGQVA